MAVDPLPFNMSGNWFDRVSFDIYLLGHDAVAGHQIQFSRSPSSDTIDIQWDARIALAYAGETEFKYDMNARVYGQSLPEIQGVAG